MMRCLDRDQIMHLHQRLHQQTGGGTGVRDEGGLQSALDQPLMSFGQQELYPTIVAKAAALGFSLIGNHPFVDGNKRIGQAAMEVFLLLHGYEVQATVDAQESIILQAAAGVLKREEFAQWLSEHVVPFRPAA